VSERAEEVGRGGSLHPPVDGRVRAADAPEQVVVERAGDQVVLGAPAVAGGGERRPLADGVVGAGPGDPAHDVALGHGARVATAEEGGEGATVRLGGAGILVAGYEGGDDSVG